MIVTSHHKRLHQRSRPARRATAIDSSTACRHPPTQLPARLATAIDSSTASGLVRRESRPRASR